jgi:dihydrofolate synthase/folylpolyglutamate synthase
LTTYKRTLDYMYAKLPMFHRIGTAAYKKDLTNTIALCNVLHNPEQKIKCLHIAGTNGKGTVSHILAAYLQACGYKTGLYVSPHYADFRERIKINGTYISQKKIIEFIENNKPHIEAIQPSFFELTVAMAFDYFACEKVEYAVIETGLGGRLDSTNVINPLLSIITNISYDHQNMLGNDLATIAFEKAGIIKSKTPVIIGQRNRETDQVFIDKANEMLAPIKFANDQFQLDIVENQLDKIIFNLRDKQNPHTITKYSTDLAGPYQPKNLLTAIASIYQLHNIDPIEFPLTKLKTALKSVSVKTNFIGRWMVMGKDPLILFDSAHNEDGIKAVVEYLPRLSYNKLHILFGTVNDKSTEPIYKLLPLNATYYFVKANIPRGKEPKTITEEALKFGLRGQYYTSVESGFLNAQKNAQKDDMILVFGSIFIIGELLSKKKTKKAI